MEHEPDHRPWAREQVLRYVALPMDRPGHQPVVKRLFKHAEERQAFNAGWDEYKKKMRGSSPRPVKFATPLGEDAKAWAQSFFEGVDKVKLERDHPGEIRDYYGRYLAYVGEGTRGAQLWVRDLTQGVSRPLSGTDDAESPVFTPDGHWIIFRINSRVTG